MKERFCLAVGSISSPRDSFEKHTCVSNARACCRSCAQPVPVEEAIVLFVLEGFVDINID